jgi:LPXTG-site transpeptidase (sortase) family protein
MKFKISLKKVFFIIILIGLVVYSVFFYRFFTGSNLVVDSASVYSSSPTKQVNPNSLLPVYLKIPKLNIDAVVENVGLTDSGAMDVPSVPMNVAWFDVGPRPGENGSSVIAGHSGYKDNIQAVFDNLYKLKIGDEIDVEDATGAMTVFIVSGLKNYNTDQSALSVFSSNDGLAHLNLITCSGDWNAVKQTHSARLVVFADKEITQ